MFLAAFTVENSSVFSNVFRTIEFNDSTTPFSHGRPASTGRGFYCLRKTGASLIEKIDPLATEMYLSHAEPGMKRSYAERDWDRLGRALIEMERRVKSFIN